MIVCHYNMHNGLLNGCSFFTLKKFVQILCLEIRIVVYNTTYKFTFACFSGVQHCHLAFLVSPPPLMASFGITALVDCTRKISKTEMKLHFAFFPIQCLLLPRQREREKENERTVARNLRRVTIQDVIVRKKRNNVLFDALKKYKHDRTQTVLH